MGGIKRRRGCPSRRCNEDERAPRSTERPARLLSEERCGPHSVTSGLARPKPCQHPPDTESRWCRRAQPVACSSCTTGHAVEAGDNRGTSVAGSRAGLPAARNHGDRSERHTSDSPRTLMAVAQWHSRSRSGSCTSTATQHGGHRTGLCIAVIRSAVSGNPPLPVHRLAIASGASHTAQRSPTACHTRRQRMCRVHPTARPGSACGTDHASALSPSKAQLDMPRQRSWCAGQHPHPQFQSAENDCGA